MDKIKIIVIGSSNVGKTAIIYHYIEHKYSEEYLMSVGREKLIKEIIIEDKTINLEIWDTGGNEKYRTVTKIFMKNSKIALIVYSIIDKRSFEELHYLIQTVKR